MSRERLIAMPLLLMLALHLAGAARGAEPFSIPIGSKQRESQPLPAGDKIPLSLDQAIQLSLKNVLDLDVSSYTYEKAAFGIGSAAGVFDPSVEVDGSANRTESPVSSAFQSSDTKTQKLNAFLSGLLPLGTTYQLGFTNTKLDTSNRFTTVNPALSTDLSLSATQPLLRNFGTAVNRRLIVQARIARDASAWDFVRSVQATVQLVDSAYWDLVYALENLKSKQEALDRAKDLNHITQIKIDVGALAPIDVVQTEVTIAQREQDIILAEGLIGDAQDRLKRLLNVSNIPDWSRPIVPTDLPGEQALPLDVDAGIRRALETRPEVKQAVIDIESKKVTLVYNRNQILPRLDLNAAYGYAGLGAQQSNFAECSIPGQSASNCFDPVTGQPGQVFTRAFNYVDAYYDIRSRNFPSWTLGFTFNVPIFNRTARNNAAIAVTDVELSRTNLELLKQNLNVEVRAAARAIDTAFRSVAAAHKARELADRNLDAEKKKYENGMTTSFNVAQIQNDLTNARSNELQAITVYQKAITAWYRSTGDLLKEKNISITGLPVTTGPTPAEEGAVK